MKNKKLNAPEVEPVINKTKLEKYDYLESFARRIGRTLEVTEEIPQLLVDIAKRHGIVIVHAIDEDMIDFLGAVNQQVCSTMYFQNEQIIKLDEKGNALGVEEKDYTSKIYCYRYSFGWSWLFKMDKNIKFEIFADKTGGLHWCQGIVFYLEDLKKQIDINNLKKENLGEILTDINLKRESISFISDIKNNIKFELAIDTKTYSPLVIFKNKTFNLPWVDILSLALDAFEKELNLDA